MMFLDTFNIPIITMSDTTAYPPGDVWERKGVIRHGAKNLHGYSHVTNPKVTIVLRRSYGGSNITMGCTKMGPDSFTPGPRPNSPHRTRVHRAGRIPQAVGQGQEEGNYQEVYDFYLSILRNSLQRAEHGEGLHHLLHRPGSDRSSGHPGQHRQVAPRFSEQEGDVAGAQALCQTGLTA